MEKSNKLIEKYIKGIVYQEDEINLMAYHHIDYISLINKVSSATKDFLENADIQSYNEDRNIREFKIFANIHDLKDEKLQQIFGEVLSHIFSSKIIRKEYEWKQEIPTSLKDKVLE